MVERFLCYIVTKAIFTTEVLYRRCSVVDNGSRKKNLIVASREPVTSICVIHKLGAAFN